MKKILLLIISIMLILSLGLTGCGQNEAPADLDKDNAEAKVQEETKKDEPIKEKTKSELEGTVNLSGSTSVLPLAEELGYAFEEKNTGVKINVTGGGSSQGIKDVANGVSDIGDASRNLKEAEESLGLDVNIIAYDGIAVVVNPENEVSDLAADQITKIFNGETTNWSEVGGADSEIIVLSREAASGTRGAFEEIMDLEGEDGSLVKEGALVFDGNGGIMAAVASKKDAIGYMSLGMVDETVKAVKVDGTEASVENIKAGKYAVQRPFLMCTKGEVSDVTKTFLDFVFSDEGQEIVSKDYISVN